MTNKLVGRWKAGTGETYFTVVSNGLVDSRIARYDYIGSDERAYRYGNMYQTEWLALRVSDRQQLLVDLKDYADACNGAATIEYDKSGYPVLYYLACIDGIYCGIPSIYPIQNAIPFARKKDADAASKHFGNNMNLLL